MTAELLRPKPFGTRPTGAERDGVGSVRSGRAEHLGLATRAPRQARGRGGARRRSPGMSVSRLWSGYKNVGRTTGA